MAATVPKTYSVSFILALVLICSTPAQSAIDPFLAEVEPNARAFQVTTLSAGIHLFRPADGIREHTNSLVFERSDGLLVVDAQPSPEAARDLLAAIALISEAPVRYLVFTHPHLAASGGGDAFPPETLRIASRGYRDSIADADFDYLAEWKAAHGIEPPEEESEEKDQPLEPDPRLVELEERPRPRATLVLTSRTRLEDPRHPIILMPIAHTHSPGDLLVFAPKTQILAVGDLLFNNRNPFAGHARIPSWIDQFNQILTLNPQKVVPLRGSAVEPPRVRNQRDALRWLRREVRKALAKNEEDEAVPEAILGAPEASRYFNTLVSPSNLELLVRQVIAEVHEERREQGLE